MNNIKEVSAECVGIVKKEHISEEPNEGIEITSHSFKNETVLSDERTAFLEVIKSEFIPEEPLNEGLNNEIEITSHSLKNESEFLGMVKCEFIPEEPLNKAISDEIEVTSHLLKNESILEEPSNEGLYSETESTPCTFNEVDVAELAEAEETKVKIGLDFKIKNEDESVIMHELAGHLPCDPQHESSFEVKSECSSKDERHSFISVKNDFDGDSSPFVDDRIIAPRSRRKLSQRHSKVYYDSRHIKLVNVCVELVDLFPSNLRKLGKAHSNSKSCVCIYCRGEYRYTSDSEDLATKNQSKVKKYRKHKKNFGVLKLRRVETVKGPFKCQHCETVFKKFCLFQCHLRVHGEGISEQRRVVKSAGTFKCQHCAVEFPKYFLLKCHLRVQHNDSEQFYT